jgi:hypothetical protein
VKFAISHLVPLGHSTDHTRDRDDEQRKQCVYLCGGCHHVVHSRYRTCLDALVAAQLTAAVTAAMAGSGGGATMQKKLTRELRQLLH